MKKLEISSGRESWSFDVQQQERGVMLNELRESGSLGALLQRPEVTGRRRRAEEEEEVGGGVGRGVSGQRGLTCHEDKIF